MKISYNWLQDFLQTEESLEKISSYLTDIGLEVEGVEPFGDQDNRLDNVVVGKVLKKEKHPNADKLHLTQINIGDETLPIVCGANNIEVGQTVAVAKIGATLKFIDGTELKIKKSKIRGIESHGMVCAEDELGISDNHEGILVLEDSYVAGTPLKKIFKDENDYVISIGLTPNRSDAMSHYGVARDLRAILKNNKKKHQYTIDLPSLAFHELENSSFEVHIETKDCKRYSGMYLKDVVVKESPDFIKNRLKSIGLKPINNIVDITNYVLHSFGQPLHAFDADNLQDKKLSVGYINQDAQLLTLDKKERIVNKNNLLIKNSANKPIALAGVMGGLETSVTEKTQNIFLESAYFEPVVIRKSAKNQSLNTDSSFRFERGVDPSFTLKALEIATDLLVKYAEAKIVEKPLDYYPIIIEPKQIILRYKTIDTLLGHRIHRDTIISILESLDFIIVTKTEMLLELLSPTYRADVTREVDVIEEILRIYGYNSIPAPEKMSFSIDFKTKEEVLKTETNVAHFFKNKGFFEALNNSLVPKKEDSESITLLNPLSNDLAQLRENLLYGLLENTAYNLNHKNDLIKLYEWGSTYQKNKDSYIETKKLALIMVGNLNPTNWITEEQPLHFYHLKGLVESLFHTLGIKFDNYPHEDKNFQESISYKIDNNDAGYLGVLDTSLSNTFNINHEVLYAELNWDLILEYSTKDTTVFSNISKYPGTRRDLSLLLEKQITYKDLYISALEIKNSYIQKIELFDVYQGKNIPDNKKSYAMSFHLQNDKKTLEDSEIDEIMDKIIQLYSSEYNVTLRN